MDKKTFSERRKTVEKSLKEWLKAIRKECPDVLIGADYTIEERVEPRPEPMKYEGHHHTRPVGSQQRYSSAQAKALGQETEEEDDQS